MKRQIQESELELFRQQVEGIERLHHDSAAPYRPKLPPFPRPRTLAPPVATAIVSPESTVEIHDYLLFSRPGIQRRVLADLQRGAIEIGLEVDLHGLYAEHARQLLAAFLIECRHRHIRCARIIHGKGYRSAGRQPVLKRTVDDWLRGDDAVLAFCSATRRDGGTGAVYVLLRNPNKCARDRRPD